MGYKAKLDHWLHTSVRRSMLDADLETLLPHLAGKVLEIGTGRKGRRGNFKPPFDQGSPWLFIDISRKVIPHAQADLHYLPCQRKYFDVVLCLEVLEYVVNPEQALLEMRRVLREGGVLILAIPFLHRMDSARDLWRYTEAGLRHMLDRAGFHLVEVKSQGHAFAVVVNILKFAIRSQRSRSLQILAAMLLKPFSSFLLWLDTELIRRDPALTSFTTGYLLMAQVGSTRKIGGQAGNAKQKIKSRPSVLWQLKEN